MGSRRRSVPSLVFASVALAASSAVVLGPGGAGAAPGALDTAFTAAASGQVSDRAYSVTTQPDGKVLVGTNAEGLLRFDADGTPDGVFNSTVPAFTGSVYAVRVQPDGKIVVGLNSAPWLVRLDGDGTPDAAFNANVAVDGDVYDLAIQPDGKIIAAGSFGAPSQRLTRLNANGTADTAFTTNVPVINATVNSIAIQPDGRIVAGGAFTSPGTHLARFLPAGGHDAAFSASVSGVGWTEVFNVAIQPDGRIVASGKFENPAHHLARFNPNGTPDTGFNANVGTAIDDPSDPVAYSLSLQGDGRIVVGGTFTSPSGYLARFRANGTVDATFNDNVDGILDGSVLATALDPERRIVAVGVFDDPGDRVARFFTTTAPAISVTPTSGTATVGEPVSGLYSIASTGGTVNSYSISPAPPPGLSFSASTGLLSGTPTARTSATTHTITAKNGTGTSSATFTLEVRSAPFRALPAPARLLDTRPSGVRVGNTETADGITTLTINDAPKIDGTPSGLPNSGIGAVALNVTVVDGNADGVPGDGYVTVYNCGTPPDASNLNFTTGQTVPNAVIAPVSDDGTICFFTYGNAHLLADASGWLPIP